MTFLSDKATPTEATSNITRPVFLSCLYRILSIIMAVTAVNNIAIIDAITMGKPKDKGPKGVAETPNHLRNVKEARAKKAPNAIISPWAKLAKFKIL